MRRYFVLSSAPRLAAGAVVVGSIVVGIGTQSLHDSSAWAKSGDSPPPVMISADGLPPLPTLEPIAKPDADPEAQKELDDLLARLVSDKPDIRDRARAALDDVPPSFVPPIHVELQGIHDHLDESMGRLLADARKAGRAAKKDGKKLDDPSKADDPDKKKSKKRKKKKADDPGTKPDDKKADDKKADDKTNDSKKAADKKADDDGDDSDDWLAFVLANPKPQSDGWRDLVHLLAMERMLVSIGSTPAVREIIELRATFGDMLRIDIQRQLERLGDKAVPALIEATMHKATVVQRLAASELDKLGRAIPGEAVASSDPDILADVLRAFGRTRNVDAVRVALSFANSDRRKVRDAAREAVAGIGEPGKWQLRDAYQDLTGDKPDKSVLWDVLARQIFALYDKGRLAEFDRLVHDGLEAAKAGKHKEAVDAFDKILARDPLFDHRKEMAPSYLALASAVPIEHADDKLALLRKAQRLDPTSPDDKKIEGQIAFVEAELLMKEGRPDRFLLERALELDPTNQDAKKALATFEEKASTEKTTQTRRFAVAGGIFAGMLAVIAAIVLWGRRSKPKSGKQPPPGDGPGAMASRTAAPSASTSAPVGDSTGLLH